MYQQEPKQAVQEQGWESRWRKAQDKSRDYDDNVRQFQMGQNLAVGDMSIHYDLKRPVQMRMQDASAYPIQMFNNQGYLEDGDKNRQENIVATVEGSTLHHIVPVNVIYNMWDQWIKRQQWLPNMEKICDYIDVSARKEAAFLQQNKTEVAKLNKAASNIPQVRKMMLDVEINIAAKKPAFEGIKREVYLNALGLVQWMPRNFVVGPKGREHDPGKNFDIVAAHVAANGSPPIFEQYKDKESIKESIKKYREEQHQKPQAKKARKTILKNPSEEQASEKPLIPPSEEQASKTIPIRPSEEQQYAMYKDALDKSYDKELKGDDKARINYEKKVNWVNYLKETLIDAVKRMENYENDIYNYLKQRFKALSKFKKVSGGGKIDISDYSKYQENSNELFKYIEGLEAIVNAFDNLNKLSDTLKESNSIFMKVQYLIDLVRDKLNKNKIEGEDLDWISKNIMPKAETMNFLTLTKPFSIEGEAQKIIINKMIKMLSNYEKENKEKPKKEPQEEKENKEKPKKEPQEEKENKEKPKKEPQEEKENNMYLALDDFFTEESQREKVRDDVKRDKESLENIIKYIKLNINIDEEAVAYLDNDSIMMIKDQKRITALNEMIRSCEKYLQNIEKRKNEVTAARYDYIGEAEREKILEYDEEFFGDNNG